jgi:steroid delta-isomerase-like uncharacterized protein
MALDRDFVVRSNRSLIERAFALQNAHEADELAKLHTDDSVFIDVPLGAFPKNHAEMKKLWTDTWAALSGFKMEPDFIVADEHGGAASFTMSGTHTGEFPGYPPTGKSFSLQGGTVIKIVDGKITAWTDYWSTGDMERQLRAD